MTRATVYQKVQLGVEVTAGTAVAAPKQLQSIDIQPSIDSAVNVFRPMGSKYATVAAQGKESSKASISSDAPTYDELAYFLAGLIGAPTITTPGGATNARLHTLTPRSSAEDAIKTFTIECGDRERAMRFAYGVVTGLALDINRDKVSLKGDMIGQLYTDGVKLSTNATYTLTAGVSPPTAGTFTLTKNGQTTSAIAFNAAASAVKTALEALSTIGTGNVTVTATVATGAGTLAVAANVYTIEFVNDLAQQPITLTGTFTGLTEASTIAIAAGVVGVVPTTLALVPILANDCSLYLADAQADLAAAVALTDGFSVSWGLTDKLSPKWVLNAANTSWKEPVETVPKLVSTLEMEADATGMGLLTQLRSGATKWLRIKFAGPEIETGQNYTLTIDMACKVTNITEFKDSDGVYGVGWELTGVHDGTWGSAFSVALTCAVASIA
jgi:hypothetical protein